jgi:hypothetical protein
MERISPATGRCVGNRPGAVRAFGPPDGPKVAADGQSRMTTFSYPSPLRNKILYLFLSEIPSRFAYETIIASIQFMIENMGHVKLFYPSLSCYL